MSKVVKVLGTGCPKCKQTTAIINEVVNVNKLDATVIKVEDIMEIMTYNVMSTPAVVIDETVVIKGRVPSKDEIFELLKTENPNSDMSDESTSCCSTS
jgi:small redox-active disulfide protein 2